MAAEEAGIFTINIFNSPNSQIHTDISNSTVEGQTNYTNSQAIENVTLTNSMLTLNVNGQNITIIDQGGNITINEPNQTPTATPTPTPTINPTYHNANLHCDTPAASERNLHKIWNQPQPIGQRNTIRLRRNCECSNKPKLSLGKKRNT